jgi:hypothetical protein
MNSLVFKIGRSAVRVSDAVRSLNAVARFSKLFEQMAPALQQNEVSEKGKMRFKNCSVIESPFEMNGFKMT